MISGNGMAPELVGIDLTERCFLRCQHCCVESSPRRRDALSTVDVAAVLEDCSRLGVAVLAFNGGEPTLRPDLADLVAEARRLGLRPLLYTNGVLLYGPPW
ncbi:MAG: radical SAM protein [Acetobacteraceae bacterium]|nr:radical SAM protein [Acetobacteraceae bacterium]